MRSAAAADALLPVSEGVLLLHSQVDPMLSSPQDPPSVAEIDNTSMSSADLDAMWVKWLKALEPQLGSGPAGWGREGPWFLADDTRRCFLARLLQQLSITEELAHERRVYDALLAVEAATVPGPDYVDLPSAGVDVDLRIVEHRPNSLHGSSSAECFTVALNAHGVSLPISYNLRHILDQ